MKILALWEQANGYLNTTNKLSLDVYIVQPRLHIPAGILRIPVFSVPNACFWQESQFSFRSNLVFRNKKEQKPSQ